MRAGVLQACRKLRNRGVEAVAQLFELGEQVIGLRVFLAKNERTRLLYLLHIRVQPGKHLELLDGLLVQIAV